MISDRSFRRRLLWGAMDLIRFSLGAMFLWSSLPKIRQPFDFLHSVYDYELVGPQLGILVAAVLPWVELLVGIALISGICVTGAMLVCAGMGAMFTFVISWALYQDLNISCGCFGSPMGERIGTLTLIRAILILIVALTMYVILVRRSAEVRGQEAPGA